MKSNNLSYIKILSERLNIAMKRGMGSNAANRNDSKRKLSTPTIINIQPLVKIVLYI